MKNQKTEKLRGKMWKSPEADAAMFKITNYSFGKVTSQSSEPSEREATGSREERERPCSTSASEAVRQVKKDEIS